jgi:hypothetical protein
VILCLQTHARTPHLLHRCIIRADGNELCQLVPRKGIKPGVELHDCWACCSIDLGLLGQAPSLLLCCCCGL